MNSVQDSVWTYVFVSRGYIHLGVGFLGHVVGNYIQLFEELANCSKVAAPFSISTSSV